MICTSELKHWILGVLEDPCWHHTATATRVIKLTEGTATMRLHPGDPGEALLLALAVALPLPASFIKCFRLNFRMRFKYEFHVCIKAQTSIQILRSRKYQRKLS